MSEEGEDGGSEEGSGEAETRPLRDVRKARHYILATLAGEHLDYEFDEDLHTRNRALWHRWATQDLDDDALKALIDAGTIPAGDVADRSVEPVIEAARERGLTSLPSPSETIDFAATIWIFSIQCFDGFWFPTNVDFQCAQMNRSISFLGTTFEGAADFESAKFEGLANFGSAAFKVGAIFKSAMFEDCAFARVTFGYIANFEGATFKAFANFGSATFEGHAIFESSTFEYEAHFDNAAFSGRTEFNHARFQRHVPIFFGASLHEGTFFHDVTWPPVPRNSPDDARRQADAYERLKLEMDRLNRHEAELRFFAKELTALRNCTPPHRALLIAAYGAISDYGRSISKPLLWVIVLWYAGGILNKVLAGWSTGMAIGFSAASLGGVLGLRREIFPEVLKGADWPVALLSAGQSVVGAVLLFLVGLALRNRFRIR